MYSGTYIIFFEYYIFNKIVGMDYDEASTFAWQFEYFLHPLYIDDQYCEDYYDFLEEGYDDKRINISLIDNIVSACHYID